METLTTKFFSFLFLTMFGGGWTVPLGVPPAKEEPVLARVAPEKCLFYASWAGMASADAKSKNVTEQLLAEPEVQRSCAALATYLSDTVLPDLANNYGAGPFEPRLFRGANNTSPDPAAIERIAVDFATFAATHPGAVFVTQIKANKSGSLKEIHGGAVIAAGEDAGKLRDAVQRFCKFAKNIGTQKIDEVRIEGATWHCFPGPANGSGSAVIFGFQGTDFVVGIGEKDFKEILHRVNGKPPAWLGNLRKRLPVERVSVVAHLNLKMLLDQVTADVPMSKTREAMHRLGLDKITAISSVSGLDGEMFTSKLLLASDGEPQGLLRWFTEEPLRADDLKPIPCDATLALAMHFDVQKTVGQLAAMFEPKEPESAPPTAAEQVLDGLTKRLQIDFRRELPKALDDGGCVYVSPREGGLVVLGATAVMPIKDPKSLYAIQLKLVTGSLAKSIAGELAQDLGWSGSLDRSPQLQSCDFAGRRIFYFTNMTICPAWCITDRELIVAMTPQNVMAYLQHGPEHKSLAAVRQVSRLTESPNGPSTMLYIDTAKLFELAYPYVTMALSMNLGNLSEKHTIALIPSAPAVRRHLVPGTAALRRTKDGLELISRQPLPGTGLLWTTVLAENPQSLEQQVAAESRSRDPARAAQEAIYSSENLRQVQDEWERMWLMDQPDATSPYRTHGGLIQQETTP